MRNLIAILAVLAMGVSAMADVTWVEDNTTAKTSVMTWTSSEPLAGMALELAVADGTSLTSVAMTGFNVFIDQAYSTPGFTTLESVNTNPAANADAPGAITDLTGTFAVCGGSLTEDHAGVSTGTIVLTADVSTTVDITADETRGGAVAMGGAAVAVTPVTATITAGPTCWSYEYFTSGDADGDGDVDTDDWPIFRDAFGTAEGDAAYNPCADFDKDGDVDTDDWPTFRDNFGKTF